MYICITNRYYSVYKRWGFSDTDIRMMKKI